MLSPHEHTLCVRLRVMFQRQKQNACICAQLILLVLHPIDWEQLPHGRTEQSGDWTRAESRRTFKTRNSWKQDRFRIFQTYAKNSTGFKATILWKTVGSFRVQPTVLVKTCDTLLKECVSGFFLQVDRNNLPSPKTILNAA
jgi:hypothetical protein